MASKSRSLMLPGKRVLRDGVLGRIEMVQHRNGEFRLATVLFEDGTKEWHGDMDEVEKLIIPDDYIHKMQRTDFVATSDTGESAVQRSPKKGIALPQTGKTDKCYLFGPTGRWYPKDLCFTKGDTPLVKWIDSNFDPNGAWPGERICDERTTADGHVQYLLKFKRYELNPGVAGDDSNEGDWFHPWQNISTALIDEWKDNKHLYGHPTMSDNMTEVQDQNEEENDNSASDRTVLFAQSSPVLRNLLAPIDGTLRPETKRRFETCRMTRAAKRRLMEEENGP